MENNNLIKILGVDLGVASIGWALIEKDEENKEQQTNKSRIIKSGVRIFTKPEDRSGNLLSAQRRAARGQRRVINRKSSRIKKIRRLLIKEKIIRKKELSTLFTEKQRIDVWELRKKALHRKLNNKEWARVLLHIAKRRGYQSNRKAEENETKDSDTKKVLAGIKQNTEKMEKEGYKTIGAMLYIEARDKKPNERIRRNKPDNYNFSISRNLLRQEIDIVFEKQKDLENPYTNDDFKEKYKEIAFTQRPLRFKASMVGKCTYEKDEYRAPKRTYTAEEYVLLSKILNTDLADRRVKIIKKTKGDKKSNISNLFEYCKIKEINIKDIFNIFKETKKPSYKTLRNKLSIEDKLIFKQVDYYKNQEVVTNINTSSKKFLETENWLSEKQKNIILEEIVSRDKNTKEIEKHKDESTKLKTRYQYRWVRNKLDAKGAPMGIEQRFNGVKYDKDPEAKEFEASLKGYHEIKNALSKVNTEVFEEIFENREAFDEIASILTYKKDDREITTELKEKVFAKFHFDTETIDKAIDKLLAVSFSDFLNLSLKAIKKLLPHLYEGKKYHEAAADVYGHHSQIGGDHKKETLRKLNESENYKITNPTVKRVFSQFRKLVNAIIREHGKLDAMHIELTRELKHSKKQRIKIAQGQKDFRNDKEEAIHNFKELFEGKEPNGKQITMFRFYKEQHGKCIYSGELIDVEKLIKEQSYAEIDHILPYSRTFDNSLNNKALCLTKKNQNKRNQTPFEWLAGGEPDNDKWHWFQEHVKSLGIKQAKQNKLFNTTLPKKRGNELNEDDTEGEGFMARNLIDTAYASKFIKNFVERNILFTDNPNIKQKVKVRSGALTSFLRHNWGINDKNRDNNLHHAEDAVILAFASQSEVQRLSKKAAEDKKAKKRLRFEPPFKDFRDNLEESIGDIFVSFAPRRKIAGAAHKDTIKSKKDTKIKAKEESKFEINKGLAEKGEIKRVDVFKNDKGQYRFIPIYPSDFYKGEFPTKDVKRQEVEESFTFQFSLFKDELIEIKKKKEEKHRFVYFKFIGSDARIQIQEHFQAKVGYENQGHQFKLSKDNINKLNELRYVSVYSNENNDFRFIPVYYIETGTETKKDFTGREIDEKFAIDFKAIGELYTNKALAITRKTKAGNKIYTFKLTNKDIQVKITDTGLASTVSKSSDVLIATATLEYIKKYQIDVLGNCTEVKKEKRLPLIKERRKIKKQKKKR